MALRPAQPGQGAWGPAGGADVPGSKLTRRPLTRKYALAELD